MQNSQQPDPFTAPHPEQARAERVYASLFRIAERHAATDEQRLRQVHPSMLGPHEAIRLVTFLLSGAAPFDDGEPAVDQADITAALSLVPMVRSEMDALEAGLLEMARGGGGDDVAGDRVRAGARHRAGGAAAVRAPRRSDGRRGGALTLGLAWGGRFSVNP
ncbi:hypothetical protein GCM10020001_036180 [Nonomuraea salmonea]